MLRVQNFEMNETNKSARSWKNNQDLIASID